MLWDRQNLKLFHSTSEEGRALTSVQKTKRVKKRSPRVPTRNESNRGLMQMGWLKLRLTREKRGKEVVSQGFQISTIDDCRLLQLKSQEQIKLMKCFQTQIITRTHRKRLVIYHKRDEPDLRYQTEIIVVKEDRVIIQLRVQLSLERLLPIPHKLWQQQLLRPASIT